MDDKDVTTGLDAIKEFIPPRIRRGMFGGASVLATLLVAVMAGYAAADILVPVQIVVALAVLGALIGPLGQLAATNVDVKPKARKEEPHLPLTAEGNQPAA